jgi:hypothetical protein
MTERRWFYPERRKPPRVQDLTGTKFGRWLVLGYAGVTDYKQHLWHCRCECGVERDVLGMHMRSGKSVSCGCFKDERTAERNRKHGLTESPEYLTWCNVKFRTQNPDHPSGEWYAKRGITMCDRWRSDFAAFYADMGPRPSDKHSIERMDNDGNYEPGNCCWALSKDQMRNTRSNRLVVYDGIEMPLIEASERSGINYGTLQWRLDNGKPLFAEVRRRR